MHFFSTKSIHDSEEYNLDVEPKNSNVRYTKRHILPDVPSATTPESPLYTRLLVPNR